VTGALHWFIPARRAVVRSTISYAALIEAWCEELERCSPALERWYGMTDVDCEDGVAEVRLWWRSYFLHEDGGVAIPRDGESTIDTRALHFMPRLWKGPRRVLLEALTNGAPPGEEIFDPMVTAAPSLTLTLNREIESPDAILLMGDVVELPLFKFLGACGLHEYGSPSHFDDVYSFDPEGSYLLGTSLAEDGPPLHDNMIAMRFQMLLGAYVGAFYHDRPVFQSDKYGVRATSDDSISPAAAYPQSLEELRSEVRRVYGQVALGTGLCAQELEKSEALPSWAAHVDETVRKKLRFLAENDDPNQSEPPRAPPRGFLWWINTRLEETGDEDERALLADLHDRVVTRLQSFVMELEELLAHESWETYAAVGGDMRIENQEALSAVAGYAVCSPVRVPCTEDHERIEIAVLVEALRKKLDALEALPGGRSPGASHGASTVYARGIIYGSTVFSAAHKSYYEGPPAWHLFSNEWCRNNIPAGDARAPKGMPTVPGGFEMLERGQPITSAAVCSDTALRLFNYMIRNHGESSYSTNWGANGVGPTLVNHPDFSIAQHYERIPAAEWAALAPYMSSEARLSHLTPLRERIEALLLELEGPTSFWDVALTLAEDASTPGWLAIDEAKRAKLREYVASDYKGKGPPAGMFYCLGVYVSQAEGEELDALRALHDELTNGALAVAEALERLRGSEPWRAFTNEGVKEETFTADRALIEKSSTEGFATGKGRDKRGKALGKAIDTLRKHLYKKIARLDYLEAHPSKVGDVHGGVIDIANFGELNTVSQSGHEWCLVRLRGHGRILSEHYAPDGEPIPRTGFLAAFDPISGEPCVDHEREEGQFYTFEATGRLIKRKDPRRAFMGCTPFVWRKVPNNELIVHFGKGGKVFFSESGQSRDGMKLMSISRLKRESDLFELHKAAPLDERPMFFHPTTKPRQESLHAERAVAHKRLVTNGMHMYRSRALPFPTLDESRGAYAEWEEALETMRHFYPEYRAHLAHL
jgi:hypothetical protein